MVQGSDDGGHGVVGLTMDWCSPADLNESRATEFAAELNARGARIDAVRGVGPTPAEASAYVDGFIEARGLERCTLVGHDWGAVIALDHARRMPGRVRGVAFLEGHIHPIDRCDDPRSERPRPLRAAEGSGPRRTAHSRTELFPRDSASVGRCPDPDRRGDDAYREPFRSPLDRRSMLAWFARFPSRAILLRHGTRHRQPVGHHGPERREAADSRDARSRHPRCRGRMVPGQRQQT
jgi:pimeloyl-ACP methyl ester carboxylesterase